MGDVAHDESAVEDGRTLRKTGTVLEEARCDAGDLERLDAPVECLQRDAVEPVV
jgi:hypothetical protein